MGATKAIEFDQIVYGNNGPSGAKDRRYYKLVFRGAIPAGYRVFWCIGSRANFVDVTGGFSRRSLVALSGIYKKLQVWGGEVHTWLEASIAPQAADYLESNPLWLMTPVRPYFGLMTTMGFRTDWTPFTYTKTMVGRLLEYEQFAGGRYFRYGSVLETDPRLRGMDCTTFPMALFDVSCDVTSNAGPNLALALSAGQGEQMDRATLLSKIFGLNANKEFTGKPKDGLYLIWNSGHIFLYRGNAAHSTYGIHEFTGSGSDGTEWKAVGYKETSIVNRYFRNVTHWAAKLPARYEPQVINTTDSQCSGVPAAESQVSIGTPPAAGGAGAGKPPANGGGGSAYTGVSGDSLSVIAGRKWNDVLLWPILYDANKQVIGSNPNLIKPGQKLTVPSIAGYSASQLSATRERGRNWR
ncbi:MAG: LysM peptidoglycan-binding domain-containing protein [Bryobacterales bacterium]|nr:LysM peptidoglycan-binding domain-containing protein [Bryobacterales bacterium]